MKCTNCKQDSKRHKFISGQWYCHHCLGISESSKGTDGILTRTRLRGDAVKHEGDFILPHKFNKITKRLEPSEEFVKKYPDRIKDYFDDSELKQYPKLTKHIKEQKQKVKTAKGKLQESVEFTGDHKEGIKKVLS